MEDSQPDCLGGYSLPVMEIFATIQGEGFHTGKAAVFIRLAGCDIGCNWCDSKSSWDVAQWPPKTLQEILDKLSEWSVKDVIVSGGEPLQNNLELLTEMLKQRGYATYLETSGAAEISGKWDWICLSPKRENHPLPVFYTIANELKVVIADTGDLLWAETQARLTRNDCLKYLQPEWSVRDKIVPEMVSYIINNPQWMLSLQSHKYIGIP